MPAASEPATAVETPEAAGVSETCTTIEAATHAMAEAATGELGEPKTVVDVADAAGHSMVETDTAEAG